MDWSLRATSLLKSMFLPYKASFKLWFSSLSESTLSSRRVISARYVSSSVSSCVFLRIRSERHVSSDRLVVMRICSLVVRAIASVSTFS